MLEKVRNQTKQALGERKQKAKMEDCVQLRLYKMQIDSNDTSILKIPRWRLLTSFFVRIQSIDYTYWQTLIAQIPVPVPRSRMRGLGLFEGMSYLKSRPRNSILK